MLLLTYLISETGVLYKAEQVYRDWGVCKASVFCGLIACGRAKITLGTEYEAVIIWLDIQ